MAVFLQVIQGPDRGKKFTLPRDEPQLIGRSSEALPITDTTVSRRHAELTPDDGKWFLRDLESANGTFVNSQPIETRTELQPGDQIRCGSTLLLYTRGTDDGETRDGAVRVMDADMFDVTVEQTMDPSEESMILAAPDPMKAAMDHLRVIYELVNLTGAVFDRETLLERVLDLVFSEFDPDRGFILFQDSPEGRAVPMAVRYKERPKTKDDERIPVSRTIIQHVLERREGILSTNAMNDRRFKSGDSVAEYGIRSAVCVPIQTADRVFGVLHIDSSLINFTFTDSQLRLLTAIGQHTALALKNLSLAEETLHNERLAVMGQTVASLSHSIKNILQGLRGGADAVELALNRDDIDLAKQGWPILSRNLNRILALTLNMLAYSRPATLEIDLIDLNQLIREAAELVQPECDRKQAGLILDLDDDMPPVPVDPDAIHQAVMNLVTNAAQAVPAKRGVVTVSSSYNGEAHEVTIAVADNGPGVTPTLAQRIFDPFTSTKGQRGTGLGLAVTKKIVEEHGGAISVESKPKQGARFLMTMPTDRDVTSPGETRLPRPMEVVDDDFE